LTLPADRSRAEVRPNTLRDQATPNAFRSQAGPGTVGRQDLNRGGGNAAPPRRVARRQPRLWVYMALAVVVVFVALYLLNGTP
jgi:hypothetical protein